MSADVQPRQGHVDPEVREQLPGLELWWLECAGGAGKTPREVRGRLRQLAGRWSGSRAIAVRTQTVPQAYRVLYRQLGVDPDQTRTPVEEVVLERLEHGGFRSAGRVSDATLLAVIETGVPVRVLDAERVEGDLALRPSLEGERLGEGPYANDLPFGRLVVSDDVRPLAVLFGDPVPEAVPTKETTRVRLYAIRAPGVPALHVEEALWTAAEVLAA